MEPGVPNILFGNPDQVLVSILNLDNLRTQQLEKHVSGHRESFRKNRILNPRIGKFAQFILCSECLTRLRGHPEGRRTDIYGV